MLLTQSCPDSHNHPYEYAVYSYDVCSSEKKGQGWRQHGVSNNQKEAFWIAEQLKSCDTIERIEIRLQGIDPKTKISKNKKIKTITTAKKPFFFPFFLWFKERFS